MADGTVIIKIKGDTSEYESAVKGIGTKTEASLGTAIKGSMIGNLFANAFTAAGSVISGAMDKAISRVDTLNRFPKVMASIGYSADDAKAAINRMSDHIQGLPTTLDSVVSSTQRIVSSVGDVGKATDIMLAFNDALVAGGQSTQVQEAAMEQFVQGVSKGKFELEEWRSITTAMPGPIDQVAKSMLGADGNANSLYEALKSGKVSVEDFTNAFVNLDNEGLNGLQSFAEQAQTGAGGIETSMENAANAVAVQVGKIIDKLNENGEITAAFDAIKQAITDAGGQISETIGFIKDHFDEIAPAVAGVVSAMVAFKTAMEISAAVQAVQKSLAAWKAANDGLRVSQILLNAVMDANPIMLIVTVIAGLVAALVVAYNTNEDFRNAVNNAWQTIQDTVGGIIEGIIGFFQMLGDALTQCGEWFATLPESIMTGLSQIGEAIANMFTSIVESIGGFFTSIGEALGQLPGMFLDWLSQCWTNVTTWAAQLISGAAEAGSGFLSNIGQFFSQLPGNILNFLMNVLQNVFGWSPQMIQGAITAASGFLNGVVRFFTQLPGRIAGFLGNVISNVGSWVGQMASNAISAASQFASNLMDGLASLPGRVFEVGSNIIDGIVNGIMSAPTAVADALSSVVNSAIDGIKNMLGIHSPSRLMRDLIGANMAEGIAVGINKDKTAIASMKTLANRITDAAENELGTIPINFQNASTTLSGLTVESMLGDAFMRGLDAVTSRLDSIDSRLKSIEEKVGKESTININGREFARLVKEYS